MVYCLSSLVVPSVPSNVCRFYLVTHKKLVEMSDSQLKIDTGRLVLQYRDEYGHLPYLDFKECLDTTIFRGYLYWRADVAMAGAATPALRRIRVVQSCIEKGDFETAAIRMGFLCVWDDV